MIGFGYVLVEPTCIPIRSTLNSVVAPPSTSCGAFRLLVRETTTVCVCCSRCSAQAKQTTAV